jgi:hypothetical protein
VYAGGIWDIDKAMAEDKLILGVVGISMTVGVLGRRRSGVAVRYIAQVGEANWRREVLASGDIDRVNDSRSMQPVTVCKLRTVSKWA